MAAKGDLAFEPQGLHYCENASETEDLLFVIVFKGSAKEPNDDKGIVHSLKAMPPVCLLPYAEADVRVFASSSGGDRQQKPT